MVFIKKLIIYFRGKLGLLLQSNFYRLYDYWVENDIQKFGFLLE